VAGELIPLKNSQTCNAPFMKRGREKAATPSWTRDEVGSEGAEDGFSQPSPQVTQSSRDDMQR
jgi:hypothetical protein